MTKTAVIVLANGFEEIEAVTPIDILRRAGVTTTVAALNSNLAQGAHGVNFSCDCMLEDVVDRDFDAVILPGGMPGSESLGNSEMVRSLCLRHAEQGKIVAAICAAPAMALAKFGLLDNKNATCYPGMEKLFPESASHIEGKPVVVDGNIVTSRGPGTAFAFGLKLVELLVEKDTADKLCTGMVYQGQ